MAMCQGKRKFGDEATARAATQRRMVTGAKRPPLYVYRCPVCQCFHLSRRPAP